MRTLLPRTARPALLTEDQIDSIRERVFLHSRTHDANELATLKPQLARDVRVLVDHHDAVVLAPQEAGFAEVVELPADDAIDGIVSRLRRFEESGDMGERATLQDALAHDALPLLRRLRDMDPRARTPTIPPGGFDLHVEEEYHRSHEDEWPQVRHFEVSLGFASFHVQISNSARPDPEPWTAMIMVNEKQGVAWTGANALESLRHALDCYFSSEFGARAAAAGFDTNAIVAEFDRLGSWLTRAEQGRARMERHQRRQALAARLRQDVESLLDKHDIDPEGRRLCIKSDDPPWARSPRIQIVIEVDEPHHE